MTAIVAPTLLTLPLVVLTTEVLRVVQGLLSVLFVPGYFLMVPFHLRKDSLDVSERVALNLGLSMAVVPLIALLLNYTPWRMRLYAIVTAVACAIAMHRCGSLFDGEMFATRPRGWAPL